MRRLNVPGDIDRTNGWIMVSAELLECFLAVVDAGGVSKAAERIGLSQPAVSQRIKRLEDEVGRRLIRRETSGERLTPEGHALLPHARTVIQALADAEEHARHPLLTGSVRLGVAEDIAGSGLPDLLGRFRLLHPGVRLKVETGLSGNLSDQLARGEFDLVLSKRAGPRQGGRVIRQEPLVWAVAPAFAHLVQQRPLPLVLHPNPSVTADAVFAALREAAIDAFVALASPGIAGLRAGVLAGLGVSAFGRRLLPQGLDEAEADEVGLPPLPDLHFGLEARDGQLPAAVEALAELITMRLSQV